jgi:hypothetical protein
MDLYKIFIQVKNICNQNEFHLAWDPIYLNVQVLKSPIALYVPPLRIFSLYCLSSMHGWDKVISYASKPSNTFDNN